MFTNGRRDSFCRRGVVRGADDGRTRVEGEVGQRSLNGGDESQTVYKSHIIIDRFLKK